MARDASVLKRHRMIVEVMIAGHVIVRFVYAPRSDRAARAFATLICPESLLFYAWHARAARAEIHRSSGERSAYDA